MAICRLSSGAECPSGSTFLSVLISFRAISTRAHIGSDTKLIFLHTVGKRDWWTGETFVQDVAARVRGLVQIATDNWLHGEAHSGSHGYTYLPMEQKPKFSASHKCWTARWRDGIGTKASEN